jgi:hypothetical protein
MILGGSIFSDSVQFMAMGPAIGSWAYAFQMIGNAASINLENVIDLKNGVFWFVLIVCLAACFVMFIFYLFNIFMLKKILPSSGILANIKSISDMLLPIIGNILFLPIVSTLLEVFI